MASIFATSLMPQQPPNYMKQSWHREQANSHDKYLLQQTFVIAPDGAIPSSKIRQRIRNIYEERIRSMTAVHHDPWDRKRSTKDLMKNYKTF
jgi:hypothetical protein